MPAMKSPLRILAVLITALFAVLAYASVQWNMQPGKSTLTFVGNQAGADFKGVFEKFTADIAFDPDSLADSRFDVTIDLTSVNSRDSERDDIIKGPDLFAAKKWPTARYVADTFTHTGGGKYSATGKLTLRNVTRNVPIQFTFQSGDAGAWLKGEAKLKRLDFGVGQGEWKDTQWVGNEVAVRFELLLER